MGCRLRSTEYPRRPWAEYQSTSTLFHKPRTKNQEPTLAGDGARIGRRGKACNVNWQEQGANDNSQRDGSEE